MTDKAQQLQAHKDERKEEVAQEKYGAKFEELSGRERQSVAGTVGGEIRKEQMTAGAGDTHAAYSEMGQQGGEARKAQMTEEHGGDTHAAYAEMGKHGGQARGGGD